MDGWMDEWMDGRPRQFRSKTMVLLVLPCLRTTITPHHTTPQQKENHSGMNESSWMESHPWFQASSHDLLLHMCMCSIRK
mmetsp:Transcript_28980/g.68080  ORF Transcript_28980/g.68080 Transcript_28980/m.68080 type:complete len:80 (+) Transcript_28980:2086-2325(+)